MQRSAQSTKNVTASEQAAGGGGSGSERGSSGSGHLADPSGPVVRQDHAASSQPAPALTELTLIQALPPRELCALLAPLRTGSLQRMLARVDVAGLCEPPPSQRFSPQGLQSLSRLALELVRVLAVGGRLTLHLVFGYRDVFWPSIWDKPRGVVVDGCVAGALLQPLAPFLEVGGGGWGTSGAAAGTCVGCVVLCDSCAFDGWVDGWVTNSTSSPRLTACNVQACLLHTGRQSILTALNCSQQKAHTHELPRCPPAGAQPGLLPHPGPQRPHARVR